MPADGSEGGEVGGLLRGDFLFLEHFCILWPTMRLFPDDLLIDICPDPPPPGTTPGPLTSTSRCQALGRVGRCWPNGVWTDRCEGGWDAGRWK